MSGYPLVLEGSVLSALVVGGGRVATRRTVGLLDAGAHVHVVSPVVTPQLEQLVVRNHALRITCAHFSVEHFGDALLVVVATDDRDANALIAAQARSRGCLVNVVSAPDQGNCITPAVHRVGDLVVAVTAGRVPAAAARIRDRLARVVDDRYAAAVRELASLRSTFLNGGRREHWADASASLVGEDFCERVEAGEFQTRMSEWR